MELFGSDIVEQIQVTILLSFQRFSKHAACADVVHQMLFAGLHFSQK